MTPAPATAPTAAVPAPAAASPRAEQTPHRTRTQALARWFGIVFVLAVLGLLVWVAQRVAWSQVLDALAALPPAVLAAALAVVVLSHVVYSTYDLLGRAWTGHTLPRRQVMLITFISYAFNLNLGSMVGGIALRFRLYARRGLPPEVIGRVFALSLSTNWLGYALLAGGVFLLQLMTPPADWTVSAAALRIFGAVLWLLVLAYLVVCGLFAQRSFSIRGHPFTLPPLRMAALQLLLSCTNWLLISVVVYLLLQRAVPYGQVLSVYLVAVVAGIILRIPGGLGVLEGVFVALLAPPLAQHTVLAALLAYRAMYYLLPLLVAALLYFVVEARSSAAVNDAAADT